MLALPFNPHAEKTALFEALTLFRRRWKQKRTINTVFALCDAIDRADDVCMRLNTATQPCSAALRWSLSICRFLSSLPGASWRACKRRY